MFLCPKRLIAPAMVFLTFFSGMALAKAGMEDSVWSYRAWQTDEGLPDNSVTGVAQTSDGFLWVATYGGLMRFDGANFAAVQLPGLLKKSVRTMLLDRHGRFWLGIETGSVICVDKNAVRTFANAEGLPTDRIAAMAEDRAGAIWVAYPSTLCAIASGKVLPYTATNGWPAGINCWVATDARGEVWFSKGGQVGLVRDGNFHLKLSFANPDIRLCSDGSKDLWLCVGDQLLKYDEINAPVPWGKLPTNSVPQVMFVDHDGTLWIGTIANGLFRLNGHSLEPIPVSQQYVDCLSEDRENNLWAGTSGGGLDLVRPSAVNLTGHDSGLPFESVASVTEAVTGDVWVVGQSGSLSRLHDGKWVLVDADSGWVWGPATCVAADKKGGVWVGTRNRTLNYYHDGVWHTWQKQDNLHGGAVHLIFVAVNNDTWVVTGSPSRLQRVRNGIIADALPLPDDIHTIRTMAEGTDGTLWVGTLEGKVLRIKNSSLVIEPAIMEPGNDPVRALAITPDGALLIGYVGAGVGWFQDGKYARITTAEGLNDDFASQLLLDGRGNVWIVGNRGLFQVSLSDFTAVATGRSEHLQSVIYSRDAGLPNFQPNSANFPNACLGSDGQLWFSTRSGLLTVQPASLPMNPVPPTVRLERVAVDDRLVAVYANRSPLRTANEADCLDLSETNLVLAIPPRHRKLEFDFAALSFSSPENVQFRYRLDNFDEQWVDAGRERSAKYPQLPAGHYQFHVLACNNAGVWNETGAALSFLVRPFFWQTWWFRGLGLFLFTASVAAMVRYISLRRLRRQMALLEQQAAVEKERTRIARDMHDEVGAKLTRLSLLTEMAGGHPDIPAAARSDVKEIADTARETIRSFEEVVWAVNPRNDTLADLVHYLCRYAEDYFEGSPLQCTIDLPPEIPAVNLPAEMRQQIFLAAKEAFNNVLKHAQARSVCVRLTTVPGDSTPNAGVVPDNVPPADNSPISGFKIIIEDDGTGFDPVSPPKRTGGGNGLVNMRERMRMIGGKLECQSQLGQGTRIMFIAPFSLSARV